ncbi:helix-turn-helix domain-containing protein [Arthrobacter citreus]|uniref:helix-turn-helix domain-containing protein n=1 Tax=Arthrobacter citreus TaxID=1670 RepID=UPI003827F1DE
MGKTFGKRLETSRQERHLSRRELGGPELAEREVSLLETGRREPGRQVLGHLAERLAAAPGCPPRAGGPNSAIYLGLAANQAWDERNYFVCLETAVAAAAGARSEDDAEDWFEMSLLAGNAWLKLGHYRFCIKQASALARHPLARSRAELRARALELLARACQGAGRLPEAVRHSRQAVESAQEGPAAAEVGLAACLSLAAALTESGRLSQAWEYCRVMVLPLAETVPDTLLAGKGFWAVGNVAFRRGDTVAGLRYHQRAAALLSPRLDVGLWASFNKASASMRLASGLHDEQTFTCIRRAEAALAVVGASRGDSLDIVHAHGRWQHLNGNYSRAVDLLSEVWAERGALSPQTAAEVALQLGLSLGSLGQMEAAAHRLQESESLFRMAGAADRSGHVRALAEALAENPGPVG